MPLNDSNSTDSFDNTIVVSPSINSGVDAVIGLTTTASELKVNASRLSERRYIFLQALDSGIKFGFDTNCIFDLFKNQSLIIPIGDIPVYAKMSSGTGDVAVSEWSIY